VNILYSTVLYCTDDLTVLYLSSASLILHHHGEASTSDLIPSFIPVLVNPSPPVPHALRIFDTWWFQWSRRRGLTSVCSHSIETTQAVCVGLDAPPETEGVCSISTLTAPTKKIHHVERSLRKRVPVVYILYLQCRPAGIWHKRFSMIDVTHSYVHNYSTGWISKY